MFEVFFEEGIGRHSSQKGKAKQSRKGKTGVSREFGVKFRQA